MMRKILKYLVPIVVCSAVAVLILVGRGSFRANGQTLYKDLSDAFFVPGIIMLCFGLLVFATNGGVFDMLAFGVIKLVDLFKRDLTKVKYRTFYDYRQAQQGRRRPYVYLLIIGGAFLLVGIVFFVLYYYAV